MKIVKLFLVFLLLASCQQNKKKNKMEEKIFNWGVSVTTPKGYPIEIHKGYIADDKQMISPFMNIGSIEQAWDNDGSDNSGGSGMPTNFSLTWLSFAEKKFWKVEGKISTTAQAKIQALFQEGYNHSTWDNDDKEVVTHITYNNLCFGLAPSGLLVLWFSGEDRRIEIETYQAQETVVSPDEFYRNPDNLKESQFLDLFYTFAPHETQDYIAKNGLPLNRWRNYRKKYNYRFNIQFYKEDREPVDRQVRYLNGETEIIPFDKLYLFQEKTLPSYVNFFFNKFNGDVTFNGEELLLIFDKLSKKHPNKEITINVKVAF
ncbi:DUF2931 family protein, partial [Flavobacterium psychrophilum]|nr:DUF2931 family protein [Flavobacterium psychrophilum]